MKTQLLAQIHSPSIPNFSLFTTPEAFQVLPELLDELLNQEQSKFQHLLKKSKESLTFEDFVQPSSLAYLRSLLNHINQVDSSEQIRQIIADFRPKYENFSNEVAYSQPYFELLQRAEEHFTLDPDQKRILELAIRDYKLRGIDLDPQKQAQLKQINTQLSQVAETFQNNVVDEQAAFSYHFETDKAL
ncbi:MAG: hypothetical protein Q4B28_07055 [bacterium]|nr:hypothetical protein [bacterium]